jgi:predicted Ser/Thr protein kinase
MNDSASNRLPLTEVEDDLATRPIDHDLTELPSTSWTPPGAPDVVDSGDAPSRPYPRPFGHYELLGEIARGGMGVVYRARQRSLGRIVALKTILAAHVSSSEAIRRFYQEAQSAAALDHPGIVAVYEVGECEGEHFYTMAFVEGVSLSSRVRADGPLAPREAARTAQAIAEAVQFANERGIVHRDLKPDNVMLDPSGRVRVTDFGLAKQLDTREQGLTVTGQIMGTPSYMSPEQALGKRDLGASTDLYAVGGILYFLLTGKAPFRGDSITEILCKVMQDRPAPPREFAPTVPATLEAICLKCLEKAPEDRYADCGQLAKALGAFVDGPAAVVRLDETVSMPPAAPPAPARRVSPVWIAAAVGVLLLGAGAAVFFFGTGKGPSALPDDRKGAAPPEIVGGDGVVPPKIAGGDEVVPEPVMDHEPAAPRRKDFGLKVDLIGAVKPLKGVLGLKVGQALHLRVETTRRAYVGVWAINHKGDITQIFPHDEEKDNFFEADTPRVVPGPMYEIEVLAGTGIEQLHVVAATKPWDQAKGQKDGPFAAFRDPAEREGWKRAIRGLRDLKVRPVATTQVSEQVLQYRVSP